MTQIIQLSKIRSSKKRAYFKRYEQRLLRFFSNFVENHFKMDYQTVSDSYLALRYQQSEQDWDYVDFREELKDAINQIYGELLWAELKQEYWFNPRWFDREEILDLCTSVFILGPTQIPKFHEMK